MAINRVTIMGNLTRDAELRKKGDATSVLTFGLAINEKKKDSETGEYVDAPVFVDCALFGARAEALAPYLTKGKKVSVDGRLRYHSWMKNEEKRHGIFRSRKDGMHLRGDSVREIPFMLFVGLLFAVTVGWWVFLTLTVSVVFGNVAATVFAVCSALSVTVGYGLVRASDSRE